jgi:hypothetical protein
LFALIAAAIIFCMFARFRRASVMTWTELAAGQRIRIIESVPAEGLPRRARTAEAAIMATGLNVLIVDKRRAQARSPLC